MSFNVLLFTQTMHSLLKSSMSLQDSLSVCNEIITGSNERRIIELVVKKLNEGERFSQAISECYGKFSKLYISLIDIGENSGNLTDVFGRLSEYLKAKKGMKQKMIQALAYPCIVMITAIIIIFILALYVMPRLEDLFMAFTESSNEVVKQMIKIKANMVIIFILAVAVAVIAFIGFILGHCSSKIAYIIDGIKLKIPLIGKLNMTEQMYDFSFAMKLFSSTSFPLVPSLKFSSNVLTNRRLKKAVESVCQLIDNGLSVSESFENEEIFPKYLTVWINIAERNGDSADAFSQVCDYYANESENTLNEITAFAEPFFILITGMIIIWIVSQFVVPVFSLLGTL